MNQPFSAHPTAVIDEGCHIGAGTKVWHFSHIMPNCTIGENCNVGQNVVISPGVVLGKMSRFRIMSLFIPASPVVTMFFSALQWFLQMLRIPAAPLIVKIVMLRRM